jgi:AraC-like DNA-binding protein
MWQLRSVERPAVVQGFYTAFLRQIDSDYVFRGETHDFHEMVILLEGSIGVSAGVSSFVLESPAAFLHSPMEFHSIRGIGGKPAVAIILSFKALSLPEYATRRFSLSDEDLARATRILHLLQQHPESGKESVDAIPPEREKDAQMAALEMEMLLLTLTESGSEVVKDGSAGARNYRRALRVIEENLDVPLNTEELARLAHMSPSLLKKTFSRYAGVGVMEYLRTRKVNAAIPRLRAGESVKDIAASLGFSDAGYFSTTFRRITGHSPTYYRKN